MLIFNIFVITEYYFLFQNKVNEGQLSKTIFPIRPYHTYFTEVYWTDEALIIKKEDVTRWEIDWAWLYGKLPEGKYRIGKEITDFRATGDYDTEIYYAEFEIVE